MKRLFQNVLVSLASLGVVLVVAEVAIRAFDLFSEARSILSMDPAGAGEEEAPLLDEIVHPFWGWTMRPGHRTDFRWPGLPIFPAGEVSEWSAANREANLFGFFSEIHDYREVDREDFVVGIFGGSVANNLVNVGGAALTEALEARSPAWKGRVEILNLASGGYKQPHQIFVLTEMILLGVPFDLVINLDGFNEVALGGSDSRSGWHPLFP